MRVLICFVLAAGCAHLDQSARVAPTPLCEALQSTSSHETKEVMIRGVLQLVPEHGSILFSEQCRSATARVHDGATVSDSDRETMIRLLGRDNPIPIDVVLKGVLRSAKEVECFGEMCAQYDFEWTHIICAKPRRRKAQSIGSCTQGSR
jgi:hypothetical protein